ncbi:hypothetical protein ABK040_007569 [Willaertia magna]
MSQQQKKLINIHGKFTQENKLNIKTFKSINQFIPKYLLPTNNLQQNFLNNEINSLQIENSQYFDYTQFSLQTKENIFIYNYEKYLFEKLILKKNIDISQIINYSFKLTDLYTNNYEKSIALLLNNNKLYLERDLEIKLIDLPILENDYFNFVTEIGVGGGYLLTTKYNNNLYVFGKNFDHSLGGTVDKYNEITLQPTIFKMQLKIIDVQCGYSHTIIRSEEGTCYGCGYNCYLNIGVLDDESYIKEFTIIEMLKNCVKKHVCGAFHSVFLTYFNDVYVCGLQEDGQLGVINQIDDLYGDLYENCLTLTKLELNNIIEFKAIAAGEYCTYLLGMDNEIICTGFSKDVFLPQSYNELEQEEEELEDNEEKRLERKNNYLNLEKDKIEYLEFKDCYCVLKLKEKLMEKNEFNDENDEVDLIVNDCKDGFFVMILCKSGDEGVSKSMQIFWKNLKEIIVNNYFSDISVML